jgi:hypothetical protein
LADLADVIRTIVTPGAGRDVNALVLDTSDAHEGVIPYRHAFRARAIGSAKKLIQPGDVIVSRLRPYLRQVAYVDAELRRITSIQDIVCSTEFFVLRSRTGDSIAFLVPFLLSHGIQDVLAASQEGGHHPRFSEHTLTSLPVPQMVVDARTDVSQAVEASVRVFRESERARLDVQKRIDEMIGRAGCEPEDR